MNKLLVTGSSGLIGSEVCSHFASLGWQVYFATPDGSLSTDESLTLSYRYSAADGERLSDELLEAVGEERNVRGDWCANLAALRFEFPRAEDPRERVHIGRVPDTLADLYFRLHQLESRCRRGDAPPNLTIEIRKVHEGFDALF